MKPFVLYDYEARCRALGMPWDQVPNCHDHQEAAIEYAMQRLVGYGNPVGAAWTIEVKRSSGEIKTYRVKSRSKIEWYATEETTS